MTIIFWYLVLFGTGYSSVPVVLPEGYPSAEVCKLAAESMEGSYVPSRYVCVPNEMAVEKLSAE